MKNIIKPIITLFFILIFLSPVYSQDNFYNFWYPDGWLVREHILLLLLPKSENLQIQFQIIKSVNLNEAVKESLNELKTLYPDDTLYNIKDYTLNSLKVKDIEGNVQNNKVNCLLLETPENKIVNISYKIPKELASKYQSEIQKIFKSLKPID